MLLRGLFTTLILLTICPAAAPAQQWELTPFAGFRFGGDLDEDIFPFEPGDFELDEGTSTGLVLGIGLSRGLRFELTWSRQETELLESRGLFDDEIALFDVDLTYYHAGVAYQWTLGQVRPFLAASLGATELDPDEPGLGSETRFSAAFGGGVKLMFSQRVGLRLEALLYATDLGGDDFCRGRQCRREEEALTQGEVRAGLVFGF